MSEAELFESAQSVWGNYLTCMTLLVTVVSAYLVAAFVVGFRLKKSQVALVNTLFGIFSLYGIAGMFGFARSGTEMMLLSFEMSTQRTIHGLTIIPEATLIVFPPLVLACYKFMWDVRHPKVE